MSESDLDTIAEIKAIAFFMQTVETSVVIEAETINRLGDLITKLLKTLN